MTADQLIDVALRFLDFAPLAAFALRRLRPRRWLAAFPGLLDGLAERDSSAWETACDDGLRGQLEAVS